MPPKTIIDKTISSDPSLVPDFISSAVQRLKPLPLDEDAIFNLKLCLHEAVVNAVKHGNKMHRDLSVHVVVKITKKDIVLDVTHQGQGFDYRATQDPTSPDNIMKLHGRGIFLIKSRMDRVRFLNQGRTIRMIKFREGKKSEYKTRKKG